MIRNLSICINIVFNDFIVIIVVDLFVLIIVIGSMGNELNISIINFNMINVI